MTEAKEPDDAFIDLKVDASAYALAATFGTVSFPKGMPDYLKDAILDRAAQAREAAGDLMIDNRLAPEGARKREAKQDADDEAISRMIQIKQERDERERIEWARTKSTVAGVTMTGAEWAMLAERLRNDSELKETILSAFRKRGMNEEEANRRYERVVDVATIAAKPPSQRTEAETEKFEKANADPSFADDLTVAQSAMKSSLSTDQPEPENGPVQSATAASFETKSLANKSSAPTMTARLDF